eukprot:TRINITY_DN25094_c0_g1_i2.p1 TRINITY_DN25094_c0_g1~~TRINITY_DN25094_c0_g1_i2.p1  ORF type:complete len:1626 (-),score=312.95 TRINITY_DN25094_c0_g1_i2:51-4928(-)
MPWKLLAKPWLLCMLQIIARGGIGNMSSNFSDDSSDDADAPNTTTSITTSHTKTTLTTTATTVTVRASSTSGNSTTNTTKTTTSTTGMAHTSTTTYTVSASSTTPELFFNTNNITNSSDESSDVDGFLELAGTQTTTATSTYASSTSTTETSTTSTTLRELVVETAELTLSRQLGLVINFNMPARLAIARHESGHGSLSCRDIFEKDTAATVGLAASCSLSADSMVLHVELGPDASVHVGQFLKFTPGALTAAGDHAHPEPLLRAFLSTRQAVVEPRALLVAPRQVDACSLVRFSAAESEGFAGFSPSVNWEFGPRTSYPLVDFLQPVLMQASVSGQLVLDIQPELLSEAVNSVQEWFNETDVSEAEGFSIIELEVVVTMRNWFARSSSASTVVFVMSSVLQQSMPQVLPIYPLELHILNNETVEIAVDNLFFDPSKCVDARGHSSQANVMMDWGYRSCKPVEKAVPGAIVSISTTREDFYFASTTSTPLNSSINNSRSCPWKSFDDETQFVDLNRKPGVLLLPAFSFSPDTHHQLRVNTSFGTSQSLLRGPWAASSIVNVHVTPRAKPIALLTGPALTPEHRAFSLDASSSYDTSIPADQLRDFEYRWSCVKHGDINGTATEENCSLLEFEFIDGRSLEAFNLNKSNPRSRGGASREILPGFLEEGFYTFLVEIWRSGEFPEGVSDMSLDVNVGRESAPSVTLLTPWLPGGRVATRSRSSDDVVAFVNSTGCHPRETWYWQWVLTEDAENSTILASLNTSHEMDSRSESQEHHPSQSLMQVSTSDFRSDLLTAGTSYTYTLLATSNWYSMQSIIENIENITGETRSDQMTLEDIKSFGATVMRAPPFIADAPPSHGLMTLTPSSGVAVSTLFTVITTGWMDEEESELFYAFYCFPLPSDVLVNNTSWAPPNIDWYDFSSPAYYERQGGLMLRSWSRSNAYFDFTLPVGSYFVVTRARDKLGIEGQTFILGPTVTEPAHGTQVPTVAEAMQLVGASNDADRILATVHALTSREASHLGTASESAQVTERLLDGLEMAIRVMDTSPAVLKAALKQISTTVTLLAASTGESLSRGIGILSSSLDLAIESENGVGKEVGDAMVQSIATIQAASQQSLEGSSDSTSMEERTARVEVTFDRLNGLISQLGRAAFVHLARGDSQKFEFVDSDGVGAALQATKVDVGMTEGAGAQTSQVTLPHSVWPLRNFARRLQERSKCTTIDILETHWIKDNPYRWANESDSDANYHVATQGSTVKAVKIEACGEAIDQGGCDEIEECNDEDKVGLVLDMPPVGKLLLPRDHVAQAFCASWLEPSRTWSPEGLRVKKPVWWNDAEATCLASSLSGAYAAFWAPVYVPTTSTLPPYTTQTYPTWTYPASNFKWPSCDYDNMPERDEYALGDWNCTGPQLEGDKCTYICANTYGKLKGEIDCLAMLTPEGNIVLQWIYAAKTLIGVMAALGCLVAMCWIAFVFPQTREYVRYGRRGIKKPEIEDATVTEMEALEDWAWSASRFGPRGSYSKDSMHSSVFSVDTSVYSLHGFPEEDIHAIVDIDLTRQGEEGIVVPEGKRSTAARQPNEPPPEVFETDLPGMPSAAAEPMPSVNARTAYDGKAAPFPAGSLALKAKRSNAHT